MDKKIYNRIDQMLYAVTRMERRRKRYDPAGGRNPTERTAIRNADLLEVDGKYKAELENWARVESEVRSSIRGSLAEQIYIRKYLKRHGYHKICRELYISKNTYYETLRHIRSYALACACQMGLMRVF
jgi:hypothetical protein